MKEQGKSQEIRQSRHFWQCISLCHVSVELQPTLATLNDHPTGLTSGNRPLSSLNDHPTGLTPGNRPWRSLTTTPPSGLTLATDSGFF